MRAKITNLKQKQKCSDTVHDYMLKVSKKGDKRFLLASDWRRFWSLDGEFLVKRALIDRAIDICSRVLARLEEIQKRIRYLNGCFSSKTFRPET